MSDGDLGFTYRVFKNGHVEVRHTGTLAATLRGGDAAKFLKDAEDPRRDLQHVMARLTGNYKRGNERQASRHPRNRG